MNIEYLGKSLSYIRQDKGLTLKQVSNDSGISSKHIRDIELGNANPTIKVINQIVGALGITWCDLYNTANALSDI